MVKPEAVKELITQNGAKMLIYTWKNCLDNIDLKKENKLEAKC